MASGFRAGQAHLKFPQINILFNIPSAFWLDIELLQIFSVF